MAPSATGSLHFCLLGAESRRFQHFAHGNNLRIEVGHLYAYGAAPGHGGDYADACCRKAHGDVVFQAFDFGDSGALGRHDFIESYRGADGGFDAYDFDVVALEGVYNHLLVGSLFTGIDFDASGAVEQQFGGRELVGRMSGPRVVQCLKAHVVAVVDFLGGILFESILGRGGAYNKLRSPADVVSILAGAASSAAVVGGTSSIIASVFSSGSTATGIVVSVAVGWLSKGSDGSSMLNPSSCPSWSMSACGASIAGSMAGAFSGSLSLSVAVVSRSSIVATVPFTAWAAGCCWTLALAGRIRRIAAIKLYGMQEHGHKQAGKNHTHGECAQCACIVNQQSVYVLAMFTT